MKPLIINSPQDVLSLGQILYSSGILDDAQLHPLAFQQFLLNGIYWELESVKGLAFLNNIVPGQDATVFILTTERPKRKYRAFVAELKTQMTQLFREFGFKRMTALVRRSNRPSRVLCGMIGFQLEGIIRSGYRHNGASEDLCVYGILSEEVQYGSRKLQQPVDHAEPQPVRELVPAANDVAEGGSVRPGLAVGEPPPVWWRRWLRSRRAG